MAQGEAAPDSDSVIVLDHDHDDDDDDGSFPREEICILSSTEASLSCKSEHSSDVIFCGSVEERISATSLSSNTVVSIRSDSESSQSSSEEIMHTNVQSLKRENIAYEVIHCQTDIKDICICCGTDEVRSQHPLFHGGLCAPCIEMFLERFFLCNKNGSKANCTICCRGGTLIWCHEPTCNRCFCVHCLDALVREGTAEEAKEMTSWKCYMCLKRDVHGLLRRRENWHAELKNFYDRESNHLWIYQPLAASERKSIHVLSLFDNITQELKGLGFLGKSMGNSRLKYLDDVTDVRRTHIKEWGPFDFIFGSTPPVGRSYRHHSAWYFFQYYRILQYGRPPARSKRPFFWMFVDNLVLCEEDRDTASRFFKMEAVRKYKQCDGKTQNAVHIWSNIPSVNSKYSASDLCEDLVRLAKKIYTTRILSQRPATLIKEFFAPLKDYFKAFP